MTDQEIFEILCSHMMVLDKKNSMDDPVFKHCYDICIENKDKMTDTTIWEIVDREVTLLKIKEEKLMRSFMKCLSNI